jgi:hypothetical protein
MCKRFDESIAGHWLRLADDFQRLAENFPAGEARMIAEKRAGQLRAGANLRRSLLPRAARTSRKVPLRLTGRANHRFDADLPALPSTAAVSASS